MYISFLKRMKYSICKWNETWILYAHQLYVTNKRIYVKCVYYQAEKSDKSQDTKTSYSSCIFE